MAEEKHPDIKLFESLVNEARWEWNRYNLGSTEDNTVVATISLAEAGKKPNFLFNRAMDFAHPFFFPESEIDGAIQVKGKRCYVPAGDKGSIQIEGVKCTIEVSMDYLLGRFPQAQIFVPLQNHAVVARTSEITWQEALPNGGQGKPRVASQALPLKEAQLVLGRLRSLDDQIVLMNEVNKFHGNPTNPTLNPKIIASGKGAYRVVADLAVFKEKHRAIIITPASPKQVEEEISK